MLGNHVNESEADVSMQDDVPGDRNCLEKEKRCLPAKPGKKMYKLYFTIWSDISLIIVLKYKYELLFI